MSTIRTGSGLAFTPEKDLEMFADMARRGKRLTAVSLPHHGWRFDDAEPEDVVFDMAYQANPSDEYFDLFRAAGWTPVLSYGHIHFFKAAPGTAPVHTTIESRLEEMVSNRDMYARYSAVVIAVVALALLGLAAAGWPTVPTMVLAALGAVALVYTTFPLVGYSRQLHRLRHPNLEAPHAQ